MNEKATGTSADASSSAAARPNVQRVRAQVPEAVIRRSLLWGVGVFVVAVSLYSAAFVAILGAPWWPLQLLMAVVAGMLIGTLFIVGHDACHGSLTPFESVNRILGRLAFLPSLTPFTSWQYAHNRIHHSYTNWRGKDYAWAPFSKEEFDRLPRWRQALERHYRSPLGLGNYYLVEYWWKHLLFLPAQERAEMKRPVAFRFDLALLIAFVALQCWAVAAWSESMGPGAGGLLGAWSNPLALGLVAIVAPFLTWNWGMAFATFHHHNHPKIAWYGKRDEWDFFAGQVESSVHMDMPPVLEWLMAHIMQHTAHHVNPKIPLYRLTQSQKLLEAAYPNGIVVERWTVGVFLRALRCCKLYDYENHRWLNFQGKPTSEPNPIMRAFREGWLPPRRSSATRNGAAWGGKANPPSGPSHR